MDFFKQIQKFLPHRNIDYSTFDLSHEHKTTMPFGKLCPVMCEEVLPGDHWHINAGAFLRTMPLISPMMHKVDLKLRFFFVPNRLVWDNWERFISDGRSRDGQPLTVPNFRVQANDWPDDKWNLYFGKGSLCDYFGFRLNKNSYIPYISQLPFRAYDLIFQEYFANQWISEHIVQDGYEDATYYNKYEDHPFIDSTKINKYFDFFNVEDVSFEPDYFTSASPNPIAVSEPIRGVNLVHDREGNAIGVHSLEPFSGTNMLNFQKDGGSSVSSIPELRNAYRLQHFLENSLRHGRRYVEQLYAHFGITTSDNRIQRPEYLGGGKLAVQVSEIASTADADTGHLGDLAGRGISVGNFSDVNFTSEEHGYLFALAYITPHTSYHGGLHRTFARSERWDYAFPEFADLGEQPIYDYELNINSRPATSVVLPIGSPDPDLKIFGYVPRYSEYKIIQDKFSGNMVDNLSFWHLGREFATSDDAPALNTDFLYINDKQREKLNRVFGVVDPGEDPFICTFGFGIETKRPLPFNPQTIM